VAAFSSQIRDDPMAFPQLKVFEPQGCQLSPPEATADEKREQSTISPTAQGVGVFSAE
jgi:hypothetical protein